MTFGDIICAVFLVTVALGLMITIGYCLYAMYRIIKFFALKIKFVP